MIRIVLVIALILVGYDLFNESYTTYRLKTSGKDAVGIVIDIDKDIDYGINYYIKVNYRRNGVLDTFKFSRPVVGKYYIGEKINLKYDTSSDRVIEDTPMFITHQILIELIASIIGILILFYFFRQKKAV